MPAQNITISVILTAYNKMAGVILGAQRQLKAFSDNATRYGRSSMMTGAIIAAPIIAAAKAYAEQEDAMLGMKSAMMEDGGGINQQLYNNLTSYAKKTSETLTGSTADYLKMIRVLQQNGIKPEEILGGIGDATARLAVLFHMPSDSIAQFAARMKQDMGIVPKEMTGMMDLIARLNGAGVGKNGEEAVAEMGEAFSKAGLGAHNLGIQGLQASKDLGALMGIFIRRGISGGTVGNNFRRIFDGLRSAEKLKKANDIAKQYGITLDFYDKDHKFKGIANFTAELNKLHGLNATQISAVLNPFSGKQGLSTDFLEFLGNEGTEAFNGLQQKLASQATLNQRVALMLTGVSKQFEIAKTTGLNTLAEIGATYAPELKETLRDFNALFVSISRFVREHRELVGTLAKGIAYYATYRIAVGAVALLFGGIAGQIAGAIKAFKFLQYAIFATRFHLLFTLKPAFLAARTAIWEFTTALLANPITWVVIAIAALAAAAYLIYKNWKPITEWFIGQWTMVKAQLNGVLQVAKLIVGVMAGIRSPLDLLKMGDAFNGGYNSVMSANAAAQRSSWSLPNSMMMNRPSLQPKPNAATQAFLTPVTIHLNGSATQADANLIGNHIEHHVKKAIEKYHANKRRVSY